MVVSPLHGISEEIIQALIIAVRAKKKLIYLDPSLVLHEAEKYLRQHPSAIAQLSNLQAATTKGLIKYVRRHFHDIYEVFQTNDIGKRAALLKKITLADTKAHQKLLAAHLSTRERLPYYPELYRKVFAITGKPHSILDLGCGLNPVSFPFMKLHLTTHYTATELCEDDCTFIAQYFRIIGLSHATAHRLDLVREYERLQDFPADLCFLFKVLDVCETQQRHITYKILEHIRAPFIVASFSLRNVKGEPMRRRKSHWFERMCRNLGYSWDTFEIPGELFYVVRK